MMRRDKREWRRENEEDRILLLDIPLNREVSRRRSEIKRQNRKVLKERSSRVEGNNRREKEETITTWN
jgi:hypothetical protein